MRTGAIIWVGILTVLCLLAAPVAHAQDASADPSSAAKSSKKRFAIGVALPLSGEYAPVGKQVLESIELAARDLGVRLVSKDTEGTPVGAIEAVRELAKDDEILAVLGPIGRRESRAAAQIAQREGIPLFSYASSDAVNRAGNWVYRLRLTPAEQARQLADAVRTHLSDQKRVGILFPESNYGREAAVAFATRFAALGGEVSAVASYPEKTTDFRKPLDELVGKRVHLGKRARYGKRRADGDGYAKIRRKASVDFDLLFIPDFHGRISRLLPFLPQAGLQTGEGGKGTAVQMLGLAGWQGSSMKLTGAHAAGAIYTDLFVGDADGGRSEDFATMFEGKTGRRPVDLDAEVFDSAWMVAKLLQKAQKRHQAAANKPSTAELRLFLANQLPRKPEFSGVSGDLGFGQQGAPVRPVKLYQFDVDGTVTPFR
ncbi:hypothetical protein FIV42_26000 [Persicimonas caeni]|uniref:Leucine-binding protein domain-containing protein n=1 Tax=Persicimonas caeni TaxID=2292766 RepID=A0A4Y6Q0W0_PERCE|nr:penicillin-binding protein activator [Persicimonas caeni]QDG54069.1 hypothetical protein FIV42_26000 [Persicimonas caeni]QED35290.1 ABC transporter substrate-binding protein [Persicimonas caeni]